LTLVESEPPASPGCLKVGPDLPDLKVRWRGVKRLVLDRVPQRSPTVAPWAAPRKASPHKEGVVARIAIIVDEMFEDSEFMEPFDRLRAAGHEVQIVGLAAKKKITGKRGTVTLTTDVAIRDVSSDQFEALVIPGGYSPDHLRTDPGMVRLTREMFESGKPVAAVCHAPWMLAEAGNARGHTMTSWPSLKTDLVNAGAHWVDREVVEDGNLISSRKPADLPKFCEAILRHLQARAGAQPPAGA